MTHSMKKILKTCLLYQKSRSENNDERRESQQFDRVFEK